MHTTRVQSRSPPTALLLFIFSHTTVRARSIIHHNIHSILLLYYSMHTLLVVILYEYCSFFTFLCIRECRTHTVHTYLVLMFCDCFALHRLSSSRFSSPHQFFHFRLRAKAKVRDCYYCSHRKSDLRLTNSATIFMHVAA